MDLRPPPQVVSRARGPRASCPLPVASAGGSPTKGPPSPLFGAEGASCGRWRGSSARPALLERRPIRPVLSLLHMEALGQPLPDRFAD